MQLDVLYLMDVIKIKNTLDSSPKDFRWHDGWYASFS